MYKAVEKQLITFQFGGNAVLNVDNNGQRHENCIRICLMVREYKLALSNLHHCSRVYKIPLDVQNLNTLKKQWISVSCMHINSGDK